LNLRAFALIVAGHFVFAFAFPSSAAAAFLFLPPQPAGACFF
jgi:hypothetical protein